MVLLMYVEFHCYSIMMQKWLQDANIPSKIILDSAIGYVNHDN